MSECMRLADQARRAFDGEAWHGDALMELLKGVTAAQAAAHPVTGAHSIWELVLHIAAWDGAALRRAGGETVTVSDEENFPAISDTSEAAWRRAVDGARKTHDEMVKAIAGFADSRLQEQVPGKAQSYYNYFYLFSGIVQHELYHAGQIAILKKALG